MAAELDLGPEGNLVDVLGFEGFEFDGEATATLRMPVRDGVKQPFGIVHGGAFAALAETVCSRATYDVVAPKLATGAARAGFGTSRCGTARAGCAPPHA
jgi:uncharacterized protein (TIGR00369 family)